MEKKRGFSKDFWLVVIGQIISLFGNSVVRFALPLHLLTVTGSAAVLGIVSGFAFVPMVIMSPVGGTIADRVNKRNIMVFLDFFTSGLTVLFLILYQRVNLTGMILVMLFLMYGISGTYQPSVQSSVPVLVEKEKVMPANAIINMISSLSGLLGPALGGVAYSAWGIYPVLAGAAMCFFASAVMEIFIHIPFSRKSRQESIWRECRRDLSESIVYITQKRAAIGRLTICCAGVNMVLSALMIIGLPVVVIQALDFGAQEASRLYGYLQALIAVGGLAGGMSAGVFSQKLKLEKSWKLLALAAFLLIPMGGVLAVDIPPLAAYGVLAVTGMMIMAVTSVYTIQIMSYIQVSVPADMVGKVIAWIIALTTCALPVGQIAYGILFEQLAEILPAIFLTAALLTLGIVGQSRKAVLHL